MKLLEVFCADYAHIGMGCRGKTKPEEIAKAAQVFRHNEFRLQAVGQDVPGFLRGEPVFALLVHPLTVGSQAPILLLIPLPLEPIRLVVDPGWIDDGSGFLLVVDIASAFLGIRRNAVPDPFMRYAPVGRDKGCEIHMLKG